MEIARERLEREFGLDLILTAPSVDYKITYKNGEQAHISNPTEFPQPHELELIEEPIVNATIMVPVEYVGAVMNLCQELRGVYRRRTIQLPSASAFTTRFSG